MNAKAADSTPQRSTRSLKEILFQPATNKRCQLRRSALLRFRFSRLLVCIAIFLLINCVLTNVNVFLSNGKVRSVQAAIDYISNPTATDYSNPMCTELLRDNSSEANATYSAAFELMRQGITHLTLPQRYLTATCEEIKRGLGVPYSYVTSNYGSREFESADDFDFSIAFSLNVFKDPYQVERLLRAIYRPQHLYCIHVDPKAHPFTIAVMAKLSVCFPNVFLSPKQSNVYWGTYSVLEADLNCMEALYNRSSTWKYWINLTGQEYPLKTNAEIVRILKALKGANALEATRKRVPATVWQRPYFKDFQNVGVVPTKGAVSIAVTRAFVKFSLTSTIAQKIRDSIRKNVTYPSPSELYFSTLNFNPQIGTPGAYLGEPETSDVYPYFARLKDWGSPPFKFNCKSGLRIRLICIWGMLDLPFITNSSRKEMYLNKLHQDFQPMTYDCLESWYWSRTMKDIQFGSAFDVSFYSSLDMVRNQVPDLISG